MRARDVVLLAVLVLAVQSAGVALGVLIGHGARYSGGIGSMAVAPLSILISKLTGRRSDRRTPHRSDQED